MFTHIRNTGFTAQSELDLSDKIQIRYRGSNFMYMDQGTQRSQKYEIYAQGKTKNIYVKYQSAS